MAFTLGEQKGAQRSTRVATASETGRLKEINPGNRLYSSDTKDRVYVYVVGYL